MGLGRGDIWVLNNTDRVSKFNVGDKMSVAEV